MVHIHAEGPAFFSWLPKMFGKRVVVTIHGIDWQREKWKSGFGSKFIRQGEKNAVKYADEIIVLSKGVQDYFRDTYGRETHFVPNGVNRPESREAGLITEKFGLTKDSYILFLGRLVPEKGIRYLVEAFKNIKTDKKFVIAGGSSDTDSFAKALCVPQSHNLPEAPSLLLIPHSESAQSPAGSLDSDCRCCKLHTAESADHPRHSFCPVPSSSHGQRPRQYRLHR